MRDLAGAVWRKSTRSGGSGGNCVEVADNLVGAVWRKSTRSGGSGGECVEVADGLPGVVGVRDSKDPSGPALVFGPAAWSTFIAGVKGTGANGG